MIKVIISGYGKMGHMVEKELERRGIELVEASEDITAVDPAVAKACVCIDFTTPDAFRANYPFIARHFKAAVVGTTGWNDIRADVFAAFEAAGTPLIYASNFSLGVNALYAAVRKASALLKGAGYVPEIEEIHHIHKLDAPSGTAITLAEGILENLDRKERWQLDKATTEKDIAIKAIREGEVPGTHTIHYESNVDSITITHEAKSREGVALGAVLAAEFTAGKKGFYDMSDIFQF